MGLLNVAPRLVLVEWEDASVVDSGTWADRTDAPPALPIVFQQVGWLLELTPGHVVLTSALHKDTMAPRDRIPLGMVRSIIAFDPSAGVPVKKPRKR